MRNSGTINGFSEEELNAILPENIKKSFLTEEDVARIYIQLTTPGTRVERNELDDYSANIIYVKD